MVDFRVWFCCGYGWLFVCLIGYLICLWVSCCCFEFDCLVDFVLTGLIDVWLLVGFYLLFADFGCYYLLVGTFVLVCVGLFAFIGAC